MLTSFVRQTVRMVLPLALVWLTLNTLVIQAQDATPAETPTEIPSPEMTEPPMALPAATPTETATEMPSQTPPEVTAEVTEPATENPVVSPTEAPTLTETAVPTPGEAAIPVEPALNLLVRELFDNGDLSPWSQAAGWSLAPSEQGYALQVYNSNESISLQKGEFFNVAAQARFLWNAGNAQLSVRESVAGRYTAAIDTTGAVSLYRGGELVETVLVPTSLPGQWRLLRLSAIQGVVRVAVDNVEVIAVIDAAPLPPGVVTLSGLFDIAGDGIPRPENTLLVDDFFLWVPEAEIVLYPSPTPVIPTPTAIEPTTTAVEPTPTPTEGVELSHEPDVVFVGKDTSAYPAPNAAQLAVAALATNDDFADATGIGSAPFATIGDTTAATLETGETTPNCGYNISSTVWFSFTPSTTANYVLSTAGSSFDTIVGVYTGSAVNALTRIACNDDASTSTFNSQLTVNLAAGTPYYIQLGGYNGRYGNYAFSLQQLGFPLPAAPTLLIPATNGITNDSTLDFTWNSTVTTAGGPFTYDLQVDNNGCTFPSPEINLTGLGTSHTPSSSLNDGLYCWRVRARNVNGQASGFSTTRSFTIDTAAPAAPGLTTPADLAIVTTAKLTLKWNAASGANGYFVDVDNNGCTFPSPEISNAPVTTTNFTPANSLPQGSYCWRVQSKDAAGNTGGESATRTFTLNILTAPLDGKVLLTTATTTTTNVTFNWAAVVGATSYNLTLLDDTCTTPLPGYPLNVGTVLTKTVTGVAHGEYCWKVQAVGVDPAQPPTFRQFVVSPPAPLPPTLLTPAVNAVTNDNTPDFTWNGTASTPGSPFSYDLQVDNNGCTFPSPEITLTGLGTNHTPVSGLADGLYCWRVRAVNTYGAPAAFSATRSFNIDTAAPGVPVLKTPLDQSTLTTNPPTFTWGAVNGAASYQIRLDTLNPPVATYTATTTSFKPSSPLLYTTYYWQAQALDKAGNPSGWSGVWSVKIGAALTAVPVLNRYAPENPPPMNLPPTLSWGPISWTNPGGYYQVQVDNNATFPSPEYQNLDLPTGTQSVVIASLPDGTWYWRVRACTAADVCGAWSTTGTFTVEG